MNQERSINKKDFKSNYNNGFICSICLNAKSDECDKKGTSCPICQICCEVCTTTAKNEKKKSEKLKTISINNIGTESVKTTTKTIEMSKSDVAQGLDLLNEVLTVFQNKKQLDVQNSKSFKHVGTSTQCSDKKKIGKLSLSKIQQYSIGDDRKLNENPKFTIVNYCQPETLRKPHHVIDLIRHKSSSIPLMKMDELKNCLREKNKSKDTIEEVNRMFANVKRYEDSYLSLDKNSAEEANRPLIRNGPRVLPVVKTCNHINIEQIEKRPEKVTKQICQCCQNKDYNMSSGDAFVKPECCYKLEEEIEKCEDGSDKLCCHYRKQNRKVHTRVTICDNCRGSDKNPH